MADPKGPDADQLALFDDPILWWPGQPPSPRRRAPRRRSAQADPPTRQQLALFDLPEEELPGGRRKRRRKKRKLKVKPTRQTYLELADTLGLPRLTALVNRPATYFMVDAWPLREGLGVPTLLDARYRVEAQLDAAFDDFADHVPEEVRHLPLTVWAGRRTGLSTARSPLGEALVLALSGGDIRALDPFILRLRGLPGYIGHEDGPSPLEDGEELLSLYDGDVLYPLLPREAQPMSLESLIAG